MLFFLAILNIIHAVLGVLVTKMRALTLLHDGFTAAAPDKLVELVERLWPASVYQPWQLGTDEVKPTPQRGYLISGAQLLASVWYLHRSHRPQP